MPHTLRPFAFAALAGLLFFGCSPGHRLADHHLDGHTVAAIAALPPLPGVFSDAAYDGGLDRRDPLGSLFRVGTALAKDREARRAEARMDSALAEVDVAERIAEQTLLRAARHLRYRPTRDPDHADYLLDIRVASFGLVADSWEAAVQFQLDADVVLVDNASGRVIWKQQVRQVEPVTSAIGGFGATVGNVFTAHALSALSVEEMAEAFSRLADYTAAHLTATLRDDYYASRR